MDRQPKDRQPKKTKHFLRAAWIGLGVFVSAFIAERVHVALDPEVWFAAAVGAFSFFFGLYLDQMARTDEHFEITNANSNKNLSDSKSHATEHFQTLNDKLDEILSRLQGGIVEPMGRAGDIVKVHSHKLKQIASNATEVKNTLIFFTSSGGASIDAERYISSNDRAARVALIEEVAKRNHFWRDIYSEEGLHFINEDIRALKSKYRSFYLPKILTHDYPVVNMILFKLEHHCEVWFGFGLFENTDGPVFRSADDGLCEYFGSYFDALDKDSRVWNDRGRQYLDGAWVSLSYDEASGRLQGVSVFTIAMIERDLVIEGAVYLSKNGCFLPENSFKTTSSKFTLESGEPVLDFTFVDIRDGQEIRKGGGFLVFPTQNNITEYTGQIFSFGGAERKIVGRKLSKDYAPFITSRGTFHVRHFVESLIQEKAISDKKPMTGDSPFMGDKFWRSS